MKISYRDMCILLVDNYAQSLDTLQDYLEPFHFYRIWTAKNVDEAMSLVAEKPVNLVISALKMKPISGMQLLEMLRRVKTEADLPLVLMNDQFDDVVKRKGQELGASGYMQQPLKPKAVQELVDRILELRVDPDQEEFLAQVEQAREAERKKKPSQAVGHLRAALGIKYDETTALNLARLLGENGHAAEAQDIYVTIIRHNRDCLKAYMSLAALLEAEGRLPEALKILAGAVKVTSRLKLAGGEQAGLYFQMGELELRLRNLAAALGMFKQAVELAPDDADLHVRIGDSLEEYEHHEPAETYYRQALDLDPSLAHIYNRLGIARRKQGKYEAAIDIYQKALQFHPQDEHLFYNVARCYYDLQRFGPAVGNLTTALDLNPEFQEAQALLVLCQSKLG
ncbi:MAG: tetratricopeptide repeat protein [Deltaproteobacteria bacterium]|nr:tetratricopeptide repeat protein [Deltaproteobacteria bacterium]